MKSSIIPFLVEAMAGLVLMDNMFVIDIALLL